MKFADLFCGIGGFRLGFERAGMECIFSCEIDGYARKIYKERFKVNHPFPKDVCKVKRVPEADIWCAGTPCQNFSVAGNGEGLEGEKSKLLYEFIRLLQSAHRGPEWIVIENVPGLLSSNGGRDFAVVLHELQECGYGLAWRVLDSRYFGVPQRRRRVFVVGRSGDRCPGEILFESEGGERTPASVRKKEKETAYTLTASTGGVSAKEQRQTLIINTSHPNQHQFPVKEQDFCDTLQKQNKYAVSVLPMGDGGICPDRMGMLVAGTVSCKWAKRTGGPSGDECQNLVSGTLNPGAHPGGYNGQDAHSGLLVLQEPGVRRLTPLECERLQGFPDGWTKGLSDTQRYKCLGNAVTVNVAEWVGKRIVEFVNCEGE